MATSIATARALTAVRIGRAKIFETISLLITRFLLPGLRSQVNQSRAFRFVEDELRRINGFVEGRLQESNRQVVVFDRPRHLNLRRVANPLKILILGVVDVLDINPLR